MSGWILLHKDIRNHWLWKNPERLKWWIDILMTVNYEDKEVSIGHRNFVCKRGEALMSIESWAKRWMVSKSAAYNFLMLIRKQNMIRIANETVTTRLIVCNFDTYQQPTNGIQTQNKRITNESRVQLKEEKKEIKKEEEKKAAPLNLEVREKKFMDDVAEFKDKYPKETLRAFYNYWSEPNQRKTKLRFEMEKTFDIGRRLGKWKDNEDTNFGKNPMPKNMPKGQGVMPSDFKITVPYLHKDVTHAANHINKETGLEIKGKVYMTTHRGEQAFSDEQGRLITEEEYNEKKQLQTH